MPPELDLSQLGRGVEEYGMGEGMLYYGRSKLALNTWAYELARRHPEYRVHAICPGTVSTNIQRSAPWYAQPLVSLLMLLFQSPDAAAIPVSCCP